MGFRAIASQAALVTLLADNILCVALVIKTSRWAFTKTCIVQLPFGLEQVVIAG